MYHTAISTLTELKRKHVHVSTRRNSVPNFLTTSPAECPMKKCALFDDLWNICIVMDRLKIWTEKKESLEAVTDAED